MSLAVLFEDKKTPGQFRVEATNPNGEVEVAVFSGPEAKERAISFASGYWYAGWADPENHSQCCGG